MADKQPTRQQVVDELRRAVAAEGYTGGFHYLEAEGAVALDNGQSVDVEALRRDLATASTERRLEVLGKVARFLVHPPRVPPTWEEARTLVLPLLKKRIALEHVAARRTLGMGAAPTYGAPLTPHVVVELAIPTPGGMCSVPVESIELWGVRPEVAFEQACHNLAQRSLGPWRAKPEAPGVYLAPWNDGWDASRILLPSILRQLPLRGRPVALAPTPSGLLVAGSEDATGLLHLALEAKRVAERERMLHLLRPMRLGEADVTWEDWMPPQGHPAHDPLRLLQAMDEVRDYAEQASIQRRLAEGRPAPLMPALEIVQARQGTRVMTITTWRAGKPAALPKADTLVFVRGETSLGACGWEQLAQAPGVRLKPLPGYPTRYLATDFPDDWQLAALDLQPWAGPRDG